MRRIALRNLKLYFRDKGNVFFSLLSVLIVIGLYACFLGDIWIEDIKGVEGAAALMSGWLSAGILTVASFTTTLGAFAVMVDDRTRKVTKDFYASPLSRRSIAGGYLVSAWTVGMAMSVVTLIFAQGYMRWQGAPWMSLSVLLKVLLILLLTTLANTGILCLLVSFLKSSGAFAAASTVIGTLVGFLTGIYLPIGSLPEGVQWAIKLFPPSHAAVLLRQIIMEPVMETSFQGAPAAVVNAFRQQVGVDFYFGNHLVTQWENILILLGTALLFALLTAFRMRRRMQ